MRHAVSVEVGSLLPSAVQKETSIHYRLDLDLRPIKPPLAANGSYPLFTGGPVHF